MACTGCYNTVSDAYCFCFVKKLCTILCLAWQCRFIQRFPNKVSTRKVYDNVLIDNCEDFYYIYQRYINGFDKENNYEL